MKSLSTDGPFIESKYSVNRVIRQQKTGRGIMGRGIMGRGIMGRGIMGRGIRG